MTLWSIRFDSPKPEKPQPLFSRDNITPTVSSRLGSKVSDSSLGVRGQQIKQLEREKGELPHVATPQIISSVSVVRIYWA